MNLIQDEVILKEGKANYMSLIQSKGGNLYLTNKRIIFEGHSFNAGKDFAVINLSEIVTINKTVTMVLVSPIPVPNAIKIGTNDGKIYKFTVNKRNEWISIIENELGFQCGDDTNGESVTVDNIKGKLENIKKVISPKKNNITEKKDNVDATTTCNVCNSIIPVRSKFCSSCGSRLENQKKYCTSCGVEVKNGQKFCLECGERLENKND